MRWRGLEAGAQAHSGVRWGVLPRLLTSNQTTARVRKCQQDNGGTWGCPDGPLHRSPGRLGDLCVSSKSPLPCREGDDSYFWGWNPFPFFPPAAPFLIFFGAMLLLTKNTACLRQSVHFSSSRKEAFEEKASDRNEERVLEGGVLGKARRKEEAGLGWGAGFDLPTWSCAFPCRGEGVSLAKEERPGQAFQLTESEASDLSASTEGITRNRSLRGCQ